MNSVKVDYGWCFDRFTEKHWSKNVYGKTSICIPEELQVSLLTCLKKSITGLNTAQDISYLSICIYMAIRKIFNYTQETYLNNFEHQEQLKHTNFNTDFCVTVLRFIEENINTCDFSKLYETVRLNNIPTWSSCCTFVSETLLAEFIKDNTIYLKEMFGGY